MSIAIIKKVKFDGARCPFSTFLRLQGDHHCACAQKWCHFSFVFKSFQTKKIKALRPKMTKIASRGGSCLNVKCHQSCLLALVFCTKLYIKLTVSLCSFSQFSFPFNFRTADALALKFGTLPLGCIFSNKWLASFDILFRSRIIRFHHFAPKNRPKLTYGRVFQHNFISKTNLKNPEQVF